MKPFSKKRLVNAIAYAILCKHMENTDYDPMFSDLQMRDSSPWIAMLDKVFATDVSSRLDEVDISWNGIESVVNSLASRFQKVLKMRYVEKLTFKEIGDKLSVSGNCAHQAHQHAIILLRRKKCFNMIKSSISGHWVLRVSFAR